MGTVSEFLLFLVPCVNFEVAAVGVRVAGALILVASVVLALPLIADVAVPFLGGHHKNPAVAVAKFPLRFR